MLLSQHKSLNAVTRLGSAVKRKTSQDKTTKTLPQLMRIPITFYTVKTQALIDTGAAASFICLSLLKQLPYEKLVDKENKFNKPVFRTVAGNVIKIKGVYEVDLQLSNKHDFKHTFYILEHLDEGCILGIDFLNDLDITISTKDRSLLYKHQKEKQKLKLPTYPLYNIRIEPEDKFNFPGIPKEYLQPIRGLLYDNNNLFADKMSELGMATAVKHTINTGDTNPINLPLRRTPESLKLVVRSHIDEMETHNIIRESTSPYAAPVVMVPKK